MTIDRKDGIWTVSCDECLNELEVECSLEFGQVVEQMREMKWGIQRTVYDLQPWDLQGWEIVCPNHSPKSGARIADGQA